MEDYNNILDSFPQTPEKDESQDFVRGALYVIIFYAAGLSLALLSAITIGRPQVNSPGVHLVIVMVTFVGGLIWTMAATAQYFKGSPSWKLKGIIFTHILAILAFCFSMYKIIHPVSPVGG